MDAVEKFVNDTIANHKVVIFSKSYCPFCNMAKEAFQTINSDYFAIELDKRDDGENIQEALHKLTGGKTVPRVFVKGKFIGGGTDVKKMQTSGELVKLVS